MKFALSVVTVLAAASSAWSFTVSNTMPAAKSFTALQMANEGEEAPRQSRFGGNSREPTIQDIAIMDDMITKMSEAKAYELPNAVSKAIRVISSPRFFMRIAERADMATDPVEKERLANLATNLVSTLDAVVSTAEDKLEDRAKIVESVVKSAAEPDSGEFMVPLSAERLDAMRDTLSKIDAADMDEGFLSTVDAWMNKSSEDGLDGMVVILQKVLQMYAGSEILRAKAALQANVGAAVAGENQAKADEMLAEQEAEAPKPVTVLLDNLLQCDTDLWEVEMKKSFAEGDVTPKKLLGEVQRIIEAIVLGLDSGSMAQRVQAEYLKELCTRIEVLDK